MLSKLKMHSVLAAFVLTASTVPIAEASWFGPSTYEQCVAKVVGTISDESVARQVRSACYAKFNSDDQFKKRYNSCIVDHATGLGSGTAFSAIRSACYEQSSGKADRRTKCILKNMKGVQSDTAARAVRSNCNK